MHVGRSVCLPWPEAHAYKYTRINMFAHMEAGDLHRHTQANTGFQQAHADDRFSLDGAAWPGTVRVCVKAPWPIAVER